MNETPALISGRLWVLKDAEDRLIEDIDTDQIFHNAHLHITDIAKMGAHAFGNLEGYRDFPNKARPGDIILAGRNFGAGSSRQQAVDCFKALGIGMILAPSFGAIYFRNAVNSAFPVLSGPRLTEEAEGNRLMTGDEIELDVRSEEGRNLTRNVMFPVTPMSDVQYQIWRSHGLFGYARTISRST